MGGAPNGAPPTSPLEKTMELYFTFPGWKRKAVSFSYDDAHVEDRRLVDTLNAYGLKGTFNISAGRLGQPTYISRDEVRTLYAGHEVASHGYAHLHIAQLPSDEMRAELLDGRRALEDILGRPVTGYASAYGEHTPETMAAMHEAGFAYARPTAVTRGFEISENPLFWRTSTHHRNDSLALARAFLANSGWGGKLLFLNVWGHSYEFERNGNWNLLEELCSLFDGRDDIWAATNMDVYAYREACRNVRITLDGRLVRNLSSVTLYARWGDSHGTENAIDVILPPGCEVRLGDNGVETEEPHAQGGGISVSPDTSAAPAAPFAGDGPFVLAFPGWRRKALTFSYDDAPAADRRLVAILNRHGLKGTFNLNTYGRPETVPADVERDDAGFPRCAVAKDEWQTLYAGHEVALHGARHETFSSVPWPVILEDVYRNKQVLEAELRMPIRGFAYPCGTSSKTAIGDRILQALDVAYGRVTAPSDQRFALPDDFLDWHPTSHHNGPIDEIGREFLSATPVADPLLCYIWGHSFEFDGKGNWDVIERFCALVAGQPDIWYATNIEICEYILAYRRLVWSVGRDSVLNPTSTEIYGFANGRPCVIPTAQR